MLRSALRQEGGGVHLDVLTYADLETLKKRKTASATGRPQPAAQAATTGSDKRYLILTYVSQFERCALPVRLPYTPIPLSSSMHGAEASRRLAGSTFPCHWHRTPPMASPQRSNHKEKQNGCQWTPQGSGSSRSRRSRRRQRSRRHLSGRCSSRLFHGRLRPPSRAARRMLPGRSSAAATSCSVTRSSCNCRTNGCSKSRCESHACESV